MVSWLLVAHVFGQMLWIGGLIGTGITLSRHVQETDPGVRQSLARVERIFLRALADPGALLTILAGIAVISTNPSYFLRAPWLHIKLTFVLVLIVMHVLIAIRAKAVGAGRATMTPGQAKGLWIAVLVLVLLILIATLPGEVFLT